MDKIEPRCYKCGKIVGKKVIIRPKSADHSIRPGCAQGSVIRFDADTIGFVFCSGACVMSLMPPLKDGKYALAPLEK